MAEISIRIPDGEYCSGCPFLIRDIHETYDIFGNEKGPIDEGWKCSRFNIHLKTEEVSLTPCNVFFEEKAKKIGLCKMKDSDRNAFMLIYIATLLLMDKEGENDCHSN